MVIGLALDDNLDKTDGVQQAVLAIGAELKKRKHEVHYIVASTKRTDIENVHSLAKSINLKFNGNSVRTPRPVSNKLIDNLLTKVKFDVIHVQMPYSPFFIGKLIKRSPKNVLKIGTFHILPYGIFSKLGTKALGIFLKKSLKEVDEFIAVSEPARAFMQTAFKVDGSVIPNPVDYDFFSSFKKSKSKKTKIVFVGRFDRRKGVKELAETYHKLPSSVRQKTELTMCGKGPLLNQVKGYSKKNNLKINFPGFVSDSEKAKFLADADIAVFPSVSGESFGIVLVEAMSAGAGVTLGGNNPGYASVLGEWPEALFNPASDDFANKLQEMINSSEKREEIGSEQKKAVKKYDIKKVVDKLEKIYSGKKS